MKKHRKNRKHDRNNPVPAVVAAITLLLLFFLLAGSREQEQQPEDAFDHQRWQLETPSPAAEVPSGFDGLAFTGGEVGDAQAAFFRLTEDSESGIRYAYVPAEMAPEVSGPLHLRLHDNERLRILDAGSNDITPEGAGTDPDGSHSTGSGDSGNPDVTPEDAGSNAENASGAWRHGDILPVFTEGEPYTFTILDEDEQPLESGTVVFLYTKNVPSMYIETESGSMEAIDGDKHHETSEPASYRVYLTDGTPDSSGHCTIRGRGNSTWSQKKRPYNLNFDKKNVLLNMESCRKYALIANFWDSTQTRQYYAFLTAERLGLEYTPQTQFVNLYLNGKYQSLYLLTQRINPDGGTVQITDLDKKNERANPNTSDEKVETVVMDTDEQGHEALACNWPNDPKDISGGYLLEFQNRYDLEDFWFETETRHMSFKSPRQPSVAEYAYISSYVREAEAALYAGSASSASSAPSAYNEDSGSAKFNEVPGSAEFKEDPAPAADQGAPASAAAADNTEKEVWEYFDMDSWARMYLIQDFFVQSDDEYYSFFFYKKPDDPLLYCGPVWDFDLCLGNMNCGDYYRTSAQTLWLRDGRKRWLHQMDQYPEFRERVATLYLTELEPVIRDLLENEYDETVNRLETDTKLNYLRWHKDLDYHERTGLVRTLLESRVQFLHDYYTDPGSFHRLLFHFAWDDFSYYVRDGESMGFLPTYDYGEKQSSVQREANGFITGWQDPATGELLDPDTVIRQDMEFDPVYIP